MNQNTLPPIPDATEENRLIYIYPPMLCDRCDRLTSVALLNSALPHWFAPRCALHGYASPYGINPTPQEQRDARTSIERFVVWMHGARGHCPVILEITPDQVPGYTISFQSQLRTISPGTHSISFEPLAWQCRYAAPGEEERIDSFVLWDIDGNQFSLYEHGQLVSTRHEEVGQ